VSMFEILNRIITVQTSQLKELPTRLVGLYKLKSVDP
jgi:hypothetical protein